MGAQIGCEYAIGGHDVRLVARDTGAVRHRVEDAFRVLEEHGLARPDELDAARGRIAIAGALDADAAACDLAVESLPEDLELKANMLASVALASPDAILATNTSSISITALGAAAGAPERVVGTHYLAPPLLMPPVEVVAGEHTDSAVVDVVRRTLVALGKQPVAVQRDLPGFVWNRLQFALLRECVARRARSRVRRDGRRGDARGTCPPLASRRSLPGDRARWDRHLESLRREHRPRAIDRFGPPRPARVRPSGRRSRRGLSRSRRSARTRAAQRAASRLSGAAAPTALRTASATWSMPRPPASRTAGMRMKPWICPS